MSYQLTDHLGNVRAVVTKPANYYAYMTSYADYYPFGEQLPGRNSMSGYRYAFQGQELDPETGMEAFQLRLWDGRIGRWLTTDPYGQYSSPYVGMGNNPVSGIDPDGGYSWFGAAWRWAAGGFSGKITGRSSNGEYGIRQPDTFKLISDNEIEITSHIKWRDNDYQSIPANSTAGGQGVNLSNTIPCNLCHHNAQMSINLPNIDWNYLKDRDSGYILEDGEMTTDFVGGKIGKNGFLYGVTQNPLYPGADAHSVVFSKMLRNARRVGDGASFLSDIIASFNVDKETINLKSYKYIDTVHVMTPRMGTYGTPLHGYKLVEKIGFMSISGKDTLKLK